MPEPLPLIVSVDDHVVEPAHVWQDRLPWAYADVGPRIVRAPRAIRITFLGGKLTVKPGGREQTQRSWWYYEDLKRPLLGVDSTVGVSREEVTMKGVTFEDMRPGSSEVKPRLEDMDVNHIEAALCFPTFPRFCGPDVLGGEEDKELAPPLRQGVQRLDGRRVVQPKSGGRADPADVDPTMGCRAGRGGGPSQQGPGRPGGLLQRVAPYLGLPSVHDPDGYWNPFFEASPEARTVVNMHIGSSSKMPSRR